MVKNINGTIVPIEDAARGLGFDSVEDMEFFYKHVNKIQEILEPSLKRWYGKASNQILFELASKVTEYIINVNH